MFALKAAQRNTKDNLSALRGAGMVPAVLYGRKEAAQTLAVSMHDFLPVWQKAGESTIISIETPNGKKSALIQDVQLHPVTNKPIHADFYAIEAGKEVEVEVPIEFTGISNAVKSLGGILVKVMHELPIKGMPEALPHEIIVDISPLETLESVIMVKDVKLPAGIVAVAKPDDAVALISVAKAEEEVSAPIDLSAIEVEKKGKKEEEGAEASAA